MATELDLEQLKQVFASLGEKLSNTKGDQAVIAKLAAVEKAIAGLNKQQAELGKKTRDEAKKDRDDLVSGFVKALEESEINKNLETAAKNQSKAGAGQTSLDPNVSKEFKNFKGLGAKVGGSMLAVSKFTNTIAAGTTSFVSNSGKLNGTISGLLSAFGVTGKTAVAVGAAMDANIDAYRGLLSSAEGTIKSIVEMRDVASAAGLTISEFSDALAKGTQGAKLLGGQNWGALYKGIKDQTRNMAFYGYTSQQLVSAQNDYLDSVANNGDIFSTGQEDLVKGFDKLLRVNDKMATILGKNREDLVKESARQAQDSNYAVKMGTYDNIDKNISNSVMAGLEQMGLGEAYKSLFINDGSFGKNDKDLAVQVSYFNDLYKQLTDLQNQVKDGKITEDQATKALQEIAATVNSADAATRNQLAIQGASDIGNGTAATKALQAASKVQQPGDNQQKENRGTNIEDEFTRAALKLGIQMKEASAGVQQFVTEMIRPWIDYFKDSWTPLSEGIDSVVNGFRSMISGMSNFSGSVMALGGLLAGGVIVTKVAGLIAPILGKSLFSGLGNILKLAFRPIAMLAGGATSLVKLLGNNVFTRAIAGAVVSGMGGLGKILSTAISGSLKGLPGIIAGAIKGLPGSGGGVGLGLGAVSMVAAVASIPSDPKELEKYMKDRHEEAAGFEDWWMANIGTPRSWLGMDQPTMHNPSGKKEDEGKSAETTAPEVEAKAPEATISPDVATAITDASSDTQVSSVASPIDELTLAVRDNTLSTNGLSDIIRLADSETKLSVNEALSMFDSTLARQTSMASEIKPPVASVDSQQLDTSAVAKAVADAGLLTQSQLTAMSQLLQRILDQLKQSLDYSQQTGAVERQSLADIAKLQEDLVRISRR